MRRLVWRMVVPLVALILGSLMVAPAFGAVSVTRAELSGTRLRVEGTAVANRDITVDGVVMGRSDGSGRFKIERDPFTRPTDCTIDVNDGSATPRTATLSGCTVTTPPPPPPSGQEAPALLSPADGASVTVPVTLAWSQVLDPASLNGGYNWRISASPAFSSLVARDSTRPSVTEDAVGGLAAGTYHWQVQAVNADLVSSEWSIARSFVVTGPGPDALAAPVLDPLPFGAHYFPMEHWQFSWSAVPGAASYTVEASRDPSFPAPVDIVSTNEPDTTSGFTFGHSLIDTWHLRVYAVDSNGVAGAPSNVETFTISYDAPIGPPPTLASPAEGASLQLPVTLDWNEAENPQNRGYEVQVATDPEFTNQEILIPPRSESQVTLVDLSAGTKYWRVRHAEGDASPTTAALTDWSAVRTFTVQDTPATVTSVSLTRSSMFSGDEIVGEVQLSSVAPAGGAVVELAVDNPDARGTLPATVTIPAGSAFTQFRFFVGQVTAATPVRLTASLSASAATFDFTVNPPSLQALTVPASFTGGGSSGGTLELNGQAPAGGALVSLTSSSPAVQLPETVTVPAGVESTTFSFTTSVVTENTPVTIAATWNGASVHDQITLTPQQPPTQFSLDKTSTTGNELMHGLVRIGTAQPDDVQIQLQSSHPDITRMQSAVTVPAGSTAAEFPFDVIAPATTTEVTVSASGGGVTLTATFTAHPLTSSTVSGVSLNPSSVTGGASSTGTVTLTSAAPTGGASVALASSNTAAATAPTSVTVPAGTTSATFTVTSGTVSASTSVTISATFGGVTRSAVLTVSPATPADTVAIQRVEYDADRDRLQVEATGTNPTATLRVFVTSTDALIGTLGNDGGGRYRGQFSWPTNPQNITVKSSLGGSATRTVTLK